MNAVIENTTVTTASTVVVQNNTTATSTDKKTTATTLLQQMEARRKKWETTVYRTSNQMLYEILAECLTYAGELPTEQARARSRELNAFLTERGYRVMNDSPLLTRVVRAVFGDIARSRISTYSSVLRRAKAEGVLPNKLPAWIEENGGVQEIRLAKSKNYVAPKERVAYVRSRFSEQPVLATVKSAELSMLADADFVGQECVLVAEQQADGSFAVRALVRGAAVTTALGQMYTELKAANDSQAIADAA